MLKQKMTYYLATKLPKKLLLAFREQARKDGEIIKFLSSKLLEEWYDGKRGDVTLPIEPLQFVPDVDETLLHNFVIDYDFREKVVEKARRDGFYMYALMTRLIYHYLHEKGVHVELSSKLAS